jgi:hypothetical protein
MRLVCACYLVLAGLLACNPSEADSDENAAGPQGELHLVEELRIDGNQADLVPIHTIAVDASGGIAVAQRQDHAVKFFDASGALIGSFGRDGEGPGEFRDVTRMGWLADTLWILDGQLNRITMVDPARRFVRTVTAPFSTRPDPVDSVAKPGFGIAIAMGFYADGSTVAYASTTEFDAMARISSDLVTQAILTRVSNPETSQTVRADGGTASPPFPNSPRLAVSPSGDLITIARASLEGPDAGSFSVTALNPRGDTVFARSYPFEAVPIPRSVADSAIAARAARLPPALAEAMRNAHIPPVFPPLANIIIGNDGTVWIQMRDTDAGRPYRIVSGNGEPVGELVLDRTRTVAAVTASSVWVLERDADDVQSIVRFRLLRQ